MNLLSRRNMGGGLLRMRENRRTLREYRRVGGPSEFMILTEGKDLS
jgi:hypothetical protein